MKVKELIKLLLKCDQEKEVYYSSSSEGIAMDISGVTKDTYFDGLVRKNVVFIEEEKEKNNGHK